jgi:hypothetical protein
MSICTFWHSRKYFGSSLMTLTAIGLTFGPLHFKLKIALWFQAKWAHPHCFMSHRNRPPSWTGLDDSTLQTLGMRRREIPHFALQRRNFIPLFYGVSEKIMRPSKIPL